MLFSFDGMMVYMHSEYLLCDGKMAKFIVSSELRPLAMIWRDLCVCGYKKKRVCSTGGRCFN
jgi:hypothetical protein